MACCTKELAVVFMYLSIMVVANVLERNSVDLSSAKTKSDKLYIRQQENIQWMHKIYIESTKATYILHWSPPTIFTPWNPLPPPLLHPTPNNTKPTYERTETTFICVTGITKMRPQKLPEIFFKMMVMTYRNQVPLFPFITWWRILKLAKEATNMWYRPFIRCQLVLQFA